MHNIYSFILSAFIQCIHAEIFLIIYLQHASFETNHVFIPCLSELLDAVSHLSLRSVERVLSPYSVLLTYTYLLGYTCIVGQRRAIVQQYRRCSTDLRRITSFVIPTTRAEETAQETRRVRSLRASGEPAVCSPA